MMKLNRYLLGLAMLSVGTMPVFSQVSNDNEDEVYKIDARAGQNDFVPGQVLVKFKDESPVNVSSSRGKFRAASISAVDAVLKEFDVETMDKLLPNAKPLQTRRRAKAYNGQMIEEQDLSQLYLVKTKSLRRDSTIQLVDKLKALDEVEYAEPNYKVYIMGQTTPMPMTQNNQTVQQSTRRAYSTETTDDVICADPSKNPLYTQQWGLEYEGLPELWSKPIIKKKRPVIAILDTGVDITHPDLVDNIWTNILEAEGESNYDNDGNGFKGDVHGWDFINKSADIRDYNSHGTHVAGIAAACNNETGIIGANPQALIMPITVMQSDGTGDVGTIIQGIDYAIANDADVLNMSFGMYTNSSILRSALEAAYQKAILVGAAGNDALAIEPQCNPIWATMFPAAYSFVLGVQSNTEDGFLSGFSNYDCSGPNVSQRATRLDPDGFNYEMMAPGSYILSTVPYGKYKKTCGTSMAAPMVSGAITSLMMVKQYETQEILWGDLLHSVNILEAYNITKRPAELDMVKVMYRDRNDDSADLEDNYSGDGQLDAGETVNVFPVLRTTFGAATNVKLHLEFADEYEDHSVIEILSGEVSFGMNLDAYAKGTSINPLILKIPSDIVDGRHVRLKVVATCDELTTPYEGYFTIIVTNMVKISGLLKEDKTLTADRVYYVDDNLAVDEGVTLTIEPGTRIEIENGVKIASAGKLKVQGTPEKPIVFTNHSDGDGWGGLDSHASSGRHDYRGLLYTNEEKTLFTLLPTEQTPIIYQVSNQYPYKTVYTTQPEESPLSTRSQELFYLADYIDDIGTLTASSYDFTARQSVLKDPTYLTPYMEQLFEDMDAYASKFSAVKTEATPYPIDINFRFFDWAIYDNPRDTISYCIIEGSTGYWNSNYWPYMKDCIIKPKNPSFLNLEGERVTITDVNVEASDGFGNDLSQYLRYSNIVNVNYENDYLSSAGLSMPRYSKLTNNNYFNVFGIYKQADDKYFGKYYSLSFWNPSMGYWGTNVDKSNHPSYLGTAREDIVRPYVYEMGNAPNTFGSIDLSNMPSRPYAEPHGIVWKVVVNGKDAQDEYEDLAPLGVGKQKFEVYFNRPMNKAKAPQISFGVREPYTQNAVAEDGEWNEEGTIYTAWVTISGKTKSDGVNRIYVRGAEDNEFFECPYEKTRFNVPINAAGSLATGFVAEAGMGRVTLTWDNTHNNFEDAMGFNVYRYTIDEEDKADTICINKEIVDIETTSYTDYDVTPGTTYYYLYRVLSTDLKEFDVSNVVAATPLTASKGDANGDSFVDVADVTSTVGYIVGLEPKPFVFEAADMNEDLSIDVLDVVGIVNKILSPSTARMMAMAYENDQEAVYTIEDGVLYIETPVALAGLQLQLALSGEMRVESGEFATAQDLKGFEQASTWLSENDYRLLVYNIGSRQLAPGKHAILTIGDAEITSLRLCDRQGGLVRAVAGENTTAIKDAMGSKVQNLKGVYNLNGQKITESSKLQRGVYIINGQKIIK